MSLALRFFVLASRTLRWRLRTKGENLLQRLAHYFEQDLPFLRTCTLHQMGIRRARITSRGFPREGSGSQAILTIEAMAFARLYGLAYAHTPLSLVAHGDRPMEKWAATWESVFNLGAEEARCEDDANDVVCWSNDMPYLHLCFGWRDQIDQLALEIDALLPELRRRYHLNKPPRAPKALSVAVHIRRGDALAGTKLLTDYQAIIRTVSTVASVLEARGLSHELCIYSQGNRADFAEFDALDAEFHLDADAAWTMQEMIEADILIMAKGCFSLYAGLMSDGIKLIERVDSDRPDLPRWRVPFLPSADKWLGVQADGSFDTTAFDRQLSLLLEADASEDASLASSPRLESSSK